MSLRFLTQSLFEKLHNSYFRPALALVLLCSFATGSTPAQRRLAPAGGQRAVVVDERLAVLRAEPSLSSPHLKRLSRGRVISLLSLKRSSDGVTFYRVAVTRRTRGWIQREAVVSLARRGDDERLFNLIQASRGFDRIARADIFLETFPKSSFRPSVLLIHGNAVEDAAEKLSIEAARRLDDAEMRANGALSFTYFMNYSGLDRYRRLEINFVFDDSTNRFHYEGKSWREIVRKYPLSAESVEARQRLDSLDASLTQRR